MQYPFTIDQFLNVFKSYNQSVFPIQILFYLIAFYCIYLILRQNSYKNKIISVILSFFWLWIGIVYHFIFFLSINKAANIFAIIYVLQGILFLLFGLFKSNLSFSYQGNFRNITGIIFIIYALIIYPVLGQLSGHSYPYSPTFGLPCPTTIFTFGILLFTDKKFNFLLLVIPLLWSVIGFGAALNFSIYEDYGLLIAGISGFLLLMIYNKKSFLALKTS